MNTTDEIIQDANAAALVQKAQIREQRLRLALESGGLGCWDLEIQTRRYLEISDIWKMQFGRPDLQEVTQEDFLSWLHPDDRDCVYDAAQKALAEGKDYAEEYRCFWPDGTLHWISAHAKLVYDEAQQPIRMIGVTQDITARHRAAEERENELQEAQERADLDPLTGLLNHRAFHRRLQEEAERIQREDSRLAIAILDVDNFKFFNDAYGHKAGDQVLIQIADHLRTVCRSYDTLARFGGDEFAVLLPGIGSVSRQEVESRWRADLASLVYYPADCDWAIPLKVSIGVSVYDGVSTKSGDVVEQADERMRRAKAGETVETEADQERGKARARITGFSMLDALVTAVDTKDRYTRQHSEDVMRYALLIVREMGLGEEIEQAVAIAALLHDVGKIGVPQQILRKPGKLTREEFEAMKLHPQIGAAIVSTVPGLEATLEAIRGHHERWDGDGYPMATQGDETPLIARMLAVADSFSAMTTDRPYRQGMLPEKALKIIQQGAAIQWDPDCVAAFVRAYCQEVPTQAAIPQATSGPLPSDGLIGTRPGRGSQAEKD